MSLSIGPKGQAIVILSHWVLFKYIIAFKVYHRFMNLNVGAGDSYDLNFLKPWWLFTTQIKPNVQMSLHLDIRFNKFQLYRIGIDNVHSLCVFLDDVYIYTYLRSLPCSFFSTSGPHWNGGRGLSAKHHYPMISSNLILMSHGLSPCNFALIGWKLTPFENKKYRCTSLQNYVKKLHFI